MKHINIKKLFQNKIMRKAIIFIVFILLIYSLISLYFINHFFFNTIINGVDVSLKAHNNVNNLIKDYIKDYKLQLIERDGEIEEIIGKDIALGLNENCDISIVNSMQSSFKWINSLLKAEKYYLDDLYIYNIYSLNNEIDKLSCLNKDIIEPKNVSFKYSNGSYKVIKEVYGNKINKDRLNASITKSILEGERILDLNKNFCYENPKYTISSDKTFETKNLLDKCVKTKVTYRFGSKNEILDGNIINKWLNVNENLEVMIDEKMVKEFVQTLGQKYNTVGASRNFKTSIGKIVEVTGGIYGWKIDPYAETKALLKNIELGEVIEREPIYAQRALYRDEDDIGNTYVEINITRQHLWFYKNGKLVTQGSVVTGNPNRGNSTKLGTFMLNYKQKGSTLRGPNYEAEVTYWMPFYGNIGIHDASWRYSFGGDIYKRNGTHGCVNTPLYLAKTIFENIDPGTPIICYEE